MYVPFKLQYRDILLSDQPNRQPQLQVLINNTPYCRLQIEAQCSICLECYKDALQLRLTIDGKTYSTTIQSTILKNEQYLQWIALSSQQKKPKQPKVLISIVRIGKSNKIVKKVQREMDSPSFQDSIINKLDTFPKEQITYSVPPTPMTPMSNFTYQSKYSSNHFDELLKMKNKTLNRIFETFDVRRRQDDENVFQLR